jgi:uncharacterized membrane protein
MTPKRLAYLPLLVVVICLPMALKLVPPNGIYGIRTPETLANAAMWYMANFRARVVGVVAGLASTILNMIVANSPAMSGACNTIVVVMTTLITAVVMTAAGLIRG